MYQIIYPIRTVAIVISTTHIDPISFLPEIEAKLKSQEFQGDLYLDLLLVNGNIKNRFVFSHFKDNKINQSIMSVRPLGMIPSIVYDEILNFHQEFPEFLKSSQVLDDEDKLEILSSSKN